MTLSTPTITDCNELNTLSGRGRRQLAGSKGGGGSAGSKKANLGNNAIKGKTTESGGSSPSLATASRRGSEMQRLVSRAQAASSRQSASGLAAARSAPRTAGRTPSSLSSQLAFNRSLNSLR